MQKSYTALSFYCRMPIRQRLKENVSRRTADEKTVKHGNIWRRLHGMHTGIQVDRCRLIN